VAIFKFALEPVLKIRRRAEQEKQRAVAAVQRERLSIEETLRRQQRRIQEARTAMRSQLTGTLHAPDLRLHAGAVLQDMRQAQRMAQELAAVHRRLEAARRELVEARRARRAIELLRERRLARWTAEQERIEQQHLDELAANGASKESRT
jgi:flagellar FliJ protein